MPFLTMKIDVIGIHVFRMAVVNSNMLKKKKKSVHGLRFVTHSIFFFYYYSKFWTFWFLLELIITFRIIVITEFWYYYMYFIL